MSPLGTKSKATQTGTFSLKALVLPAYIVLSGVFILYIGYSYFQGVVYNSGVSLGQQQGYEAAITQLMNQAGTQCEPVALTAGDQQVDVINIACLQQQAPEASEVMEKTEDQ